MWDKDKKSISTLDKATVLHQVTMSLTQAYQNGWVSRGTGATIFAAMIAQLGITIDPAEEMTAFRVGK